MRRSAFSICACLVGGLCFASPALAQFEEPDTVRPIALGAFVNLNFRGERGKATETSVSFGDGPSVGGRVDYRLSRTLTIGAVGSFARTNEKQQGNTTGFSSEGFWLIAFSGELLLKVKANVPGYFAIGGGARRVVPDEDDPSSTQFTRLDSFTEAFGLVGAGVEFASTRRRALRFDLRLFLISPADEPRTDFDTNSLELDFAAGLSFLYRP